MHTLQAFNIRLSSLIHPIMPASGLRDLIYNSNTNSIIFLYDSFTVVLKCKTTCTQLRIASTLNVHCILQGTMVSFMKGLKHRHHCDRQFSLIYCNWTLSDSWKLKTLCLYLWSSRLQKIVMPNWKYLSISKTCLYYQSTLAY